MSSYQDYLEKGVTHSRKKQFEDAIKAYNNAIKLDPNNISAYNGKGNAYDDLKMYKEAIKAYNMAIKLDPNNTLAYINKGIALKNQDKHDEALKLYDLAIKINPYDTKAFNCKGNALDDLKKFREAIKNYDISIKINPNDPAVHINKGISLYHFEKYEEAIKSFNHAIKLDPNDIFAYINKGKSLKNLKKYQDAIKSYDIAIKLNPQDPSSYNNKGNALDDLKQYKEAIKSYDIAIKLNPKDYSAYINKGIAYKKQKKFDDAIKSYNKAIKTNPNNPLAYNCKGNTLDDLKQYKEAIESYDIAIKLNPNEASVYINKGIALKNQKLYEEAIKAYNIAIKLDPNDALAFANRGNLKLNMNKNSEALEDLKKSKYLIDINKTEGLSEENINFIRKCIEALIKLETMVEMLNKEIKKNESCNNPAYEEITNKKEKLYENINEQLKNLKFEGDENSKNVIEAINNFYIECSQLHKRAINELHVEIKKIDRKVTKIGSELNEIKDKICKMEKDIDARLINYLKLLERDIENEELDYQIRAKNYFFGFSNTFSNIYITSSVVDSEKVQLENSNIGVKAVSFVGSLFPFVGKVVAGGIKSVWEFVQETGIKKRAKKILKISYDSVALGQMIGSTILKIIGNENKRKQIFEINEEKIKPRMEGFFQKMVNLIFKLKEDLKKVLYGELYDNPGKRLGFLDANDIIEKYIASGFNEPYEFEFSKFLIDLYEEKIKKQMQKKLRTNNKR